MTDLEKLGAQARTAAYALARLNTEQKNAALYAAAVALRQRCGEILAANAQDLAAARAKGMKEGLLDRLALSEARVEAMAQAAESVAALPDPVGETLSEELRPNGLRILKKRVPLGVVGIIYEARPNVTLDAFALCFKASNAVILKGGSDAIRSNLAIAEILRAALGEAGITPDAVQLIADTDRETANRFMRLNGYVDVLIPRGSAGLIRAVVENASVPVIETGAGNCHIYIDENADAEMAADIVYNAKTQRIGVCNAAESLVVHAGAAGRVLPVVAARLAEKQVELRADEAAYAVLASTEPYKAALEHPSCGRTPVISSAAELHTAVPGQLLQGCTPAISPASGKPAAVPGQNSRPALRRASEDDWGTEYLDYIMSVKTVQNLDEAISHINRYSTKHSECIVTEDAANAERFLNEIDSACVYWNASTRFTDGGCFGFGAEIGISTSKLHARGPMGLRELTSYKYEIIGNGQVRA